MRVFCVLKPSGDDRREKCVRPFRWLTMAMMALLLAACSGGAPRDAEVVIPPGASIARAGEILEQAGAVSAASFRHHARLFRGGDPIKPGESRIKKGMAAGDILSLRHAGTKIPPPLNFSPSQQ